MNDKISVIVPVYNTEPYLKRCIESIQNQTYDEYELVLVDDGSTDNSGTICDKYAEKDERIKVIHKTNTGVSDTRNIGLEHITGKYFMFLDSDDSLEAETLKKCYESLEKEKADVVVFGRTQLKNGQVVEREIYEPKVLTNMQRVVYDILEDRHIYGGGYPNKIWRTSTYNSQKNGIPKYNTNLFYVEDMEWVIRMFLHSKKMVLIRDSFYNYYLRDDSVSQSVSLNEKRLVGYHDTMSMILEDIKNIEQMYYWFQGIVYTELVNSTLDALLKKQKNVFRELYIRMLNKEVLILQHRNVKAKIKMRYILIRVIGRGVLH